MEQAAGQPKYRVGMVSRLTGLSTHVLRVWERRYRAVVPTRTAGGGRLYSDSDVAKLKLLAELTAKGHSIGAVAQLPVDELERMLERPEGGAARVVPVDLVEVRKRFLDHILALDVFAAEQLLSKAAIAYEPRELLERVVAPILVEIGRRWEAGELRVAHEHAASSIFRSLVGALSRVYGPQGREGLVVAATPAGERHELGALMAAMVAATLGYRVLYLGPDLPAEEVRFAAEAARADVLLLSFVCLTPAAARRELSRVLDGLPPKVLVLVGGASAPTNFERAQRLETLADLNEALRRRPRRA